MVLIYPLAPAEFHYVGGVWEGDVRWSYVFAGMALSIGFGLVGIALAVGGEVSAHRTAAGQVAKTHPTEATRARVALSLAILDLILGPAAFVLFGVYAGTAAAIAFGLTGIVLAGRSRTGAYRVVEGPVVETLGVWPTRAKVGLAFALLILILGPVALGGVAVLTGVALSIGLGLVGVVLAVRSEREAYRTAEGLRRESLGRDCYLRKGGSVVCPADLDPGAGGIPDYARGVA